MAAATVVVFGELHGELEKAKESLKCIDENIKKLTGRDPAEARAIALQRRGPSGPMNPVADNFNHGRPMIPGGGGINRDKEIRRWDPVGGDGPPQAKRRALGTVYGRLGVDRRDRRGGRDNDSGDDMPRKPTMQSSVVVHPKEQKTRKDCIDEQKTDATGMARNRRMFGLLLGTLQKFRVESQQTHDKEQKRMEIERKLDETAEKEKEDLRRERLELFQERKRRQGELRRLEFKMELVRQHEEWEKHYDHLKNFIRTKTKPHLYYLPREAGAVSDKRLADTRQEIDAMIAEKRQRIEEDVTVLGKRRAELASAIEAASVAATATTTATVVEHEGSLAVATKRKRQGNDAKNGKADDNEEDDDDDEDDSSSTTSSSSGSDSSSSDDDDDDAAAAKKVDDVVDKPRPSKEEVEVEGEQEDSGADGDHAVEKSLPKDETSVGIAIPAVEITQIQGGKANDNDDDDVAIKLEPDVYQVTASGDANAAAVAAEATKKDDGKSAIFDRGHKQDLLDQNNLTEKEFEPIYD